MSQQREWKTIKEYQDILFEFYNGIARLPSIVPATAMRSLQLLRLKSAMRCTTAASVRTST